MCFLLPGIIYAAISPFLYLVTKVFRRRAVMMVGLLIEAVAIWIVANADEIAPDKYN